MNMEEFISKRLQRNYITIRQWEGQLRPNGLEALLDYGDWPESI